MPTTNRGYATPATGTEVDNWGNVLNDNADLIDANLGAVASVSLSSSNVTLNSTQYANGTIALSGTLSADVIVTFPAVSGWWTVVNNTAPTSSLFVVQLAVSGGSVAIGLPWGVPTDVYTDGSGIYFRKIGDVATYYDYAGATAPRWLTFCTKPPLLLCDGSTFNASTYPVLNSILGGNTLPDTRGRSRFSLDGGTSRVTTAGSGIDGTTRFSAGGAQNVALTTAQLASHTHTGATESHLHATASTAVYGGTAVATGAGGSSFGVPINASSADLSARFTGSSAPAVLLNTTGDGDAHNNMPPAYIGGVTLMWAA